MADLHQRIRQALHAHLARVHRAQAAELTITDSTNLCEAGILDSFAFVEMVVEAGQQLGLTIDLSEARADELATISGLARCLARGAEVQGPRTEASTRGNAADLLCCDITQPRPESCGENSQESHWTGSKAEGREPSE